MPGDRSTRTLVAAGLFVLALLIGMNYLVDTAPILDWWLPLVLAVVGAVMMRPERQPQSQALTVTESAYTVREYTFTPRDVPPTLAATDQPGEVNVSEPRDEEESQGHPTHTNLAADPPEEPIAAPETLTPPASPEPKHTDIIEAPETLTPPAEDENVAEDKLAAEDEYDKAQAGIAFAPPESAAEFLNPPTESDSAPGVAVQPQAPVQTKDPARSEMPLSEIQPQVPADTDSARLERDEKMLQPYNTAENEFQTGEQVEQNLPTDMPPVPTQTTGEGMGTGTEAMPPEQKAVLDHMAAPAEPQDREVEAANDPAVVEAIVNGEATAGETQRAVDTETISPTSASGAVTGSATDDLTVIVGIGKKMAQALRNAGISSYTQLSMASDQDLTAAIEKAGMRFAPSLHTWREQAIFLARGDKAGFEAIRQRLAGDRRGEE